MKILLVGNYAEDRQKSMTGFADMLFQGLAALGHDVELFLPRRVLVPRAKRTTGIWKWVAYVDKFVISSLLLFFKVRRFDLVHVCDHSNAMYWPFIRSRPNTVTCHDVIAIQAARGDVDDWPVGTTGKFFQKLIFAGLTRFERIICVSELTRQDLVSLSGRTVGISVVHNGLDARFQRSPPAEAYASLSEVGLAYVAERGYVLHVGSGHARKNRLGVLTIYKQMRAALMDSHSRPHMLFVGPGPDAAMASFLKNHDLGDHVSFVSDVSQATLVNLYSGAVFFLFPSLQEGFGWPVVEAQICGCPVLTVDKAPMNEVGGDGAIYFPPGDYESAAKSIIAAMEHTEALVQRGLENARRFSCDTMASGYANVMTGLLLSKKTST